jgi:hypothetical protein
VRRICPVQEQGVLAPDKASLWHAQLQDLTGRPGGVRVALILGHLKQVKQDVPRRFPSQPTRVVHRMLVLVGKHPEVRVLRGAHDLWRIVRWDVEWQNADYGSL